MMTLAGTSLHPLQTGTCRTEGRFSIALSCYCHLQWNSASEMYALESLALKSATFET